MLIQGLVGLAGERRRGLSVASFLPVRGWQPSCVAYTGVETESLDAAEYMQGRPVSCFSNSAWRRWAGYIKQALQVALWLYCLQAPHRKLYSRIAPPPTQSQSSLNPAQEVTLSKELRFSMVPPLLPDQTPVRGLRLGIRQSYN